MGSYTFRWEHPADTVYVTGTFDNWSGNTHKLDKEGSVHQTTIALPAGVDKIDYKFVADGVWKHDPTHNTETDETGNINNFITASDIMPATINSSGPGATTADLAGQVPLETPLEGKAKGLPGAFPETPAATSEEQTFSVNPIPATAGTGNPITLAAGEPVPPPHTLTDHTINTTVRDDEALKNAVAATSEPEEQAFGVAPIPAMPGGGNPITLAPGEPVPAPETLTGHDLESNVKLDQASYEKSDAAALSSFPRSADTIDKDAATAAAASHGLGTTNIIPESSLGTGADAPSGLPTIHSVGDSSTTNDLAGLQPKEARREAYVIEEGGNAAAGSEQTGSSTSGGVFAALAGGAAAAGAAAAGTAVYLNEKAKETTGVDAVAQLPESVQTSIADAHSKTGVPAEVSASQAKAFAAPEASANPEAVEEKSAVEQELVSKVPEAEPTTTSVATPAVAAASVPSEVVESQHQAHAEPEASANPTAVQEKSALEKELLAKVPATEEAGEPAPTATAETSAIAPSSAPAGTGAAVAPTTTVSSTHIGGTSTATAPSTTAAAPVEHVGIAPNVSAHGAPQLGAVGPIAPINLDTPVAATTDASENVSPLTSPGAEKADPAKVAALAAASGTTAPTPRKNGGANSTPQKRQSMLERFKSSASNAGSPKDKETTTAAEERPGTAMTTATSTAAEKKEKRKSFFGRIKEKVLHSKEK